MSKQEWRTVWREHGFQVVLVLFGVLINIIGYLTLRSVEQSQDSINRAERNIQDATRDIRTNTERIIHGEIERARARAEIEAIRENHRELRETVARQWNEIRQRTR